MATVKIHYDDSAKRMENYLKDKKGREELTTEHLCFLDGVTSEFTSVQKDFCSKGNNAIHLIQSWSPKESRTITPETVHQMGVELVTRFAPGHQYIVQTHTDQPHAHNHILLNPVSLETGKRIQNKLGHIETLRNINDDIAKERGLSVLPPQERLRRSGPNEKALRINQYRGRSYIVDLVTKANFALEHATNYDEYALILGAFDIGVRVEPKNITYFYPGREHGKRGKRLDPKLDKERLEKKFEMNRDLRRNMPALQKPLSEVIAGYPDKAPPSPPVSARGPMASEGLIQATIPREELQNAKTKNILLYCEKEKIELERLESGQRVIKDRNFIEVSDYTWTNHRNKTQGNAIDFVAHHRQTSYLHAISILNNNPRLMLLEDHLGVGKKAYQSFYFPKGETMPRDLATNHLVQLLGHTRSHKVYPELFKRHSIYVTEKGVIQFFPDKDPTGYVEYIPQVQGGYRKQTHGNITAPFYQRRGRGEELQLFVDAETFLKRSPTAMMNRSSTTSVMALLEPNLPLVYRAATERSIKRVRLVCDEGQARDPELLRFKEEMARALNPFSIDVSMAWEPAPELATKDKELDYGRELSREIPFHGQ